MPRYVSLLRGINVGGHRVKMEELRRHFSALKFARVETFIASGNVLFDAPGDDAAKLEAQIERHLARVLGYETPTFIRTLPELAATAKFQAFAKGDMANAGYSRYVFFLRAAPDASVQEGLARLRSATDEFRAHGREIYWLCRGKITEVSTAWQPFEKLLKTARAVGTSRNLNMLQKLVSQFADDAPAAATSSSKPAGRHSRR